MIAVIIALAISLIRELSLHRTWHVHHGGFYHRVRARTRRGAIRQVRHHYGRHYNHHYEARRA